MTPVEPWAHLGFGMQIVLCSNYSLCHSGPCLVPRGHYLDAEWGALCFQGGGPGGQSVPEWCEGCPGRSRTDQMCVPMVPQTGSVPTGWGFSLSGAQCSCPKGVAMVMRWLWGRCSKRGSFISLAAGVFNTFPKGWQLGYTHPSEGGDSCPAPNPANGLGYILLTLCRACRVEGWMRLLARGPISCVSL